MIGRALLVWVGLRALAVANGGVRGAVFIPRVGETMGRALSSVTLSVAILVLTWVTIGWIGPRTAADAWGVGGVWVALVLAFEFLAGHYLFGKPWRELLADYDLGRGRIWIVVLLTTVVAPILAGRARGLLP